MTGAFPSLIIRADGYAAQGAFAEAQAEYLDPDPEQVARVEDLLRSREAGVVAHFYMDAELQGVLYACDWPHIHISDSLVMADRAVAMARGGSGVTGAKEIVVLGVDFMSENVRAILDEGGHAEVGCWRVAEAKIGCSLAESAEGPAYAAWLRKAAATPNSLHVVYINTSLRTKANAHHLVPTITCTSSNVVATVLQTFAQAPDAHLWFGPDTYMGHNLAQLFASMAELDDATIAAVHPAHTRATLTALLPRFHYFEQGNCVVHHMFGAAVAEQVQRDYYAGGEVDITAHLEVPGEMFALALAAQREGRGVIGSTKNILDHIVGRLDAAIARHRLESGEPERLRFVLGTEAGMVTAIVRAIRQRLAEHGRSRDHAVEVEIIFPVAAEAITATREPSLPIIPGVSGGEGCSSAGGCATCPYMKMNSLDALCDLLARLPDRRSAGPAEIAAAHARLAGFEPEKYSETIAGQTVAALGTTPILHMREFQRSKALSPELLADMRTR